MKSIKNKTTPGNDGSTKKNLQIFLEWTKNFFDGKR